MILLLLIPTLFVSNLVTERELRHEEVVKDVSRKWASAQTISGPYLFIPYTTTEKDKDGKAVISNKHFILLPETLQITGSISPEQRLRSIYKVLLYRSTLQGNGQFQLHIPTGIDPSVIRFHEAKICMGISDFKGIEQMVTIRLGDSTCDLAPGLPVATVDSLGLSAPAGLTAIHLNQKVGFTFSMHLKGSEQLHFTPLAGNSQFVLRSDWSSPSFDGNTLPSERDISDKGFTAKWSFNKANLPFTTILSADSIKTAALDFGVTMVQPADQYAKATRCIKYALLFIGLTFGLFFIVELLQKNPVHPVQYVLIGLALVIFYTLLLSISEFIRFDYAYITAAIATITLIALYAKGHFKKWSTAVVFGSLLTVLYGFIFVLIRLEDTALLIGSIGLFIILSLIMYYSRKIRWYHVTAQTDAYAATDTL